jgi:hypothetical protein
LSVVLGVALAGTESRGQEFRGETAAVWLERLTSGEPNAVRRRGAFALGRISPPTDEAVTALGAALQDRDLVTRWYAADSLGRLGAEAAPALERLVFALTDSTNDNNVRRNVAKALARIGPAAAGASPKLVAALAHEDKIYQLEAAVALWRIEKHDRAAETVWRLVEDGDERVAYLATRAVPRVGQVVDEKLPTVIAQLRRKSTDNRRAAAELLGREYGERAAPELLKLLTKPTPSPQGALAGLEYIVAKADPEGEELLSSIVTAAAPLTAAEDNDIREHAERLVDQCGAVALTSLVESWSEQSDEMRVVWLPLLRDLTTRLTKATPPGVSATQRQRLERRALEFLVSDESLSQTVGLLLLAELGSAPTTAAELAVLREQLRGVDVVNRRNAARVLRRSLAKKTPQK